MRAVFGELDTDHLRRLRELLRALTEWMNNPRRLTLLAADRSALDGAQPALPGADGRGRGRRARGGPPASRRARTARERDDIVAMLEQAHREDGSPLSEQELRDELITLLVDGPTSTSLAWAFERLLRHPREARAPARGGARRRRGALHGRRPEGDPAPVPARADRRAAAARADAARRLHRPGRRDGRALRLPDAPPRGASIRSPRSFLPERFLERPAGTYTWIPFGGGRAPLPGRELRAAGDEARCCRRCSARSSCVRSSARSERVARSSIAFVPDRQALAVVVRRPPVRHARPI